MKWWDRMPWSSFFEFWTLSQLLHSPLSPSSRGSLVPSSLPAIRVAWSTYLRLLIFLPAILIPANESTSPAFLMMYFVYKLNKQGDNIQPWRTPFPILNQSDVLHPILTAASCPAYRFLRIKSNLFIFSYAACILSSFQKIIVRSNVMEIFPYLSFWEFYSFKPSHLKVILGLHLF